MEREAKAEKAEKAEGEEGTEMEEDEGVPSQVETPLDPLGPRPGRH